LDVDRRPDDGGRPRSRLSGVASALAPYRDLLGRVAVYDSASQVTLPGMAAGVREALQEQGVNVPVGGGSNANFAELNRASLPLGELDFVTYGINPQMHHFDDASIMDTLLAQPHTVRDARLIAGKLPIVVGPVTLHPRGLDSRQATDFLAAWTVGSLAALSGADAVTYFDTTGVGTADTTFPIHRVFAAIAGLAGEPVYPVDVPSREVTALAVGPVLLLANLRDTPGSYDLGPYEVRVVDR
jgi:hypothetical protein